MLLCFSLLLNFHAIYSAAFLNLSRVSFYFLGQHIFFNFIRYWRSSDVNTHVIECPLYGDPCQGKNLTGDAVCTVGYEVSQSGS